MTDVKPNTFKLRQRVRDSATPPLVIVPMTLTDPAIVEIMGFAGAEAVLIDCEHGMLGPESARSMMVHATASGIAAVFRPRSFDSAACRQALDQGAAGIHVPHVDNADQVAAVVSACRYAPLGQREMSLGRAIQYDIRELHPYVTQSNECQLLVVMIESLEGLQNVEEIAAVPGIDVLHVGVADLTHAMGLKFGRDNREIDQAMDRILAAAERHGITVGYPSQEPDKVAHWAAKGVRYFEADTPDYLLREVYSTRLAAVAEILERVPARQHTASANRSEIYKPTRT